MIVSRAAKKASISHHGYSDRNNGVGYNVSYFHPNMNSYLDFAYIKDEFT